LPFENSHPLLKGAQLRRSGRTSFRHAIKPMAQLFDFATNFIDFPSQRFCRCLGVSELRTHGVTHLLFSLKVGLGCAPAHPEEGSKSKKNGHMRHGHCTILQKRKRTLPID
jgi:hypothetical protein